MICYDSWTGTIFIADPEDIHEKMAKIQELLLIEAHKPESLIEQYYRAFGSSILEDKPWSWIFNN